MLQEMQNIAVNDFLNACKEFNPINLHSKNNYEIIETGLEVFMSLPHSISASLFVFEQTNSTFVWKSSLNNDETIAKKSFQKLIDFGTVAEALNSLDIISTELKDCNNYSISSLVVPLLIPSGVIGIVIIDSEISIINNKQLINLCKNFAYYFAAVLHNHELKGEVEDLKEVTEQKVALRTKEIAQSKRELKVILDSVHTGILIIDKYSDRVTDANLAAADIMCTVKDKLFGLSRKDILIETVDNEKKNDKGLSKEGIVIRYDMIHVPVLYTISEVTLGANEYFIVSFVDITQLKLMEEELQKARNELEKRVEERTNQLSVANNNYVRQILENLAKEEERLKLYWAVHQSPVSIIITDLKGDIEYINPCFTNITGYNLDEVKGNNPRFLKSGDLSKEVYEKIWNTITTGNTWHGEFRNKKKNGEYFWVSASISAIKNPLGEISHYLSVQEDITFKKNAEKELIAAKLKAEESDKLKSTMLANMSHEFRTPLIGILGFSQFLINELQNPEHIEMITDISISGKRLLNTLDGVLYLSQLETISSTLKLVKSDISFQLREVVLPFVLKAKERGLILTLEINSFDLYSKIDKDLFNKSIGNLIDNAIKYTPEGTIEVVLNSAIKDNSEFVEISIRDTGIGVDEKDQKIIFEAFRQASEGYSRNYEGCGLGLTLAHKMIELMHGEIILISEPNKGSTFTILLPKSI